MRSNIPQGIKSIQRGTITLISSQSSNTATINAVNTSKAVLIPLGWRVATVGDSADDYYPTVALTDATTITAQRGGGGAGGDGSLIVAFEVVEYF